MANFIWGANGEQVTPEEIEQRKQIAQSLLGQSRQMPAYNWAQGAANMFDSFMGGFMQGRAMKAERANDEFSQAKIAAMEGDGAFGGAGTDVNQPQTNPYLGSDDVMRTQGGGDQSDPFGGAGTDVNHPAVAQALIPSMANAPQTAPNPVASALVNNPQTPVRAVAQQGALDAITQDVMDHLKNAESGGRINARNPNSSASGPYQIINATADGIRHNHPELGLTPGWQTDPNQVEIGAKAGAQDNLAALLAKGIHPTEGQFYQSWFTNPNQTSQIAQADQNAPISSILSPAQIRANPFLRNMTVGDFGRWSAGKMGQTQSAQAPVAAQPQVQAQPAPASAYMQMPVDTGPSISQLTEVLADPRLNSSAKGVASVLLNNKLQQNLLVQQEQLRQSDPLYRAQINSANALTEWRTGKMNAGALTGRMQQADEYARSRGLSPGSVEYNQAVDFYLKSGGTNVSVNTGNGGIADAASKAYATKSGENLAAQEQDGEKSGSLMGLGKTLEYLAPQIGGGGLTAEMANRLGAYMPDGWKPQGQGQREQFQSLVSEAIRQSHVPGEGPQSDADAARLSATMPQIMNSVQGNIAIARTIQALAQRKMDIGKLAGQQGRGEITPEQRAEAVRNLPDPYAAVRSFWGGNNANNSGNSAPSTPTVSGW